MPDQSPTTRTMTISEAKKTLSSLVTEVGQGTSRIVLEKAGAPVAALVSDYDLTRLERFDREWDERTQAIRRFSRAFADVPTHEAEAEVARIIAEVRRRRAVETKAEAERRTA